MTKQELKKHINEFLASCERRQLSSSTIRLYNVILSEMENKMSTGDLRQAVTDHINNLAGKPGTIQLKITIIKRFFGWLVKNGLCEKDPTVSIESLKVQNARVRFLSIAEIRSLLGECGPVMRVIVSIALLTGLRRSTVLGLKRAEIDLANRRIEVRTKGGSIARIPIVDQLVDVLSTYFETLDSPVYLFPNKKGTGPLDNNAMVEFRNTCWRAGIEDFHFHDLRHTFASHFLRNTRNLYMLQNLLGHSSISMTQRYAHIMDADRIEAMANYGSAMRF